MTKNEKMVWVAEVGHMMAVEAAKKFRAEQAAKKAAETPQELDIEVEYEFENRLEYELSHGSVDNKIGILHYLHTAGIASIDDIEGRDKSLDEIRTKEAEEKRILKEATSVEDLKDLLKDNKLTSDSSSKHSWQQAEINKREIKEMNAIHESLTGNDPNGFGDYIAGEYQRDLAHSLRDKKGFLYRATMQSASVLEAAGITDHKGIAKAIDEKLLTEYGLLSSVVHVKEAPIRDGIDEYIPTTTVDVAEEISNIIKEGRAFDTGAISLDIDSDISKLASTFENNPLFNALVSMKASRAVEAGSESIYSRVFANSLASLTGFDIDSIQSVIFGTPEVTHEDDKSRVLKDAKAGLGERYKLSSDNSARVYKAIDNPEARFIPEMKPFIDMMGASPVLRKSTGKALHAETAALIDDYVALLGIDDAKAKELIISGTFARKAAAVTAKGNLIRYNAGDTNAVTAMKERYEHAEAVLSSYTDATPSGDDALPRLLSLMELERKSKVEGDERVSPDAQVVGRGMDAKESKAEREFIDAFGNAFGFPTAMKKEARKMYSERQKFKNGAYAEVLETYTAKAALESTCSLYGVKVDDFVKANSGEDMGIDDDVIKMINEQSPSLIGTPKNPANPLSRSMEAAVLIAMDVKDHYNEHGMGDEFSLEDCMVEVIGSMGGMIGLPVDDQTNVLRRFQKTGEMEELVANLVKYKEVHKNSRALKERDAYGLISADVDFARGSSKQMDLNHVWGTMHLYAMAAKAAYGDHKKDERATMFALGAQHMDRPDINDGAMIEEHLDPILKHLYTNKRMDVSRFESGFLSKHLKEKVVERDQLIASAIDEIVKTGKTDMAEPKYLKIRDTRMPEGLPVEIVRLFGAMQSTYGAILKDGKYEAEEAYLLTQALPMIGVRDPEMVDKIAGVSFPGHKEVQRDPHGRIGALDQGLTYMQGIASSKQYNNVMKAMEFAGVTDMQKN